ncbi:hypothetical protein [Muricoccus aerilatus]|uniref:hypothetical protein n=1 Tax=Muricoccus aerilatus TaxID=452982 RepID=UPI0005C204EC|nr:hypothetical protein [Roseomonas aerilata]
MRSDETEIPLGTSLPADMNTRLLVLEMTIAAVAARLPQPDFEEVVSMLVFVAKSSDAARAVEGPAAEMPYLDAAERCATAMLNRIAISRRTGRPLGRH